MEEKSFSKQEDQDRRSLSRGNRCGGRKYHLVGKATERLPEAPASGCRAKKRFPSVEELKGPSALKRTTPAEKSRTRPFASVVKGVSLGR